MTGSSSGIQQMKYITSDVTLFPCKKNYTMESGIEQKSRVKSLHRVKTGKYITTELESTMTYHANHADFFSTIQSTKTAFPLVFFSCNVNGTDKWSAINKKRKGVNSSKRVCYFNNINNVKGALIALHIAYSISKAVFFQGFE